MAKVITFSRVFPAYHPKKGEPTYFVEAILTQLGIDYKIGNYFARLVENNPEISPSFLTHFFDSLKRDVSPKSHTIRAHKNPLKVGEYINPVCWAGKPYNKTKEGYWQIKFAPDIEIKKTFEFKTTTEQDSKESDWSFISLNKKHHYTIYSDEYLDQKIKDIAKNDGFTNTKDFFDWFDLNRTKKQILEDEPKVFEGNIICWNNLIVY